MSEHYADSFGAKKSFAGKYCCFNLIYFEYFPNITMAIDREKFIKDLTRKKKEDLISFFNPEWRFFNNNIEIEKGGLPVWTLELEDNKPW